MVKMTNEVEWARLIFGIGWRSGYGFNLMQASSHGGFTGIVNAVLYPHINVGDFIIVRGK